MREKTMSPRARPLLDSYRMNASQIPLLRAIGFAILGILVLFHDKLVAPKFTTAADLWFISFIGAYCLLSWLILRYGYNRIRIFDLGLAFLILDIPFMLAVIHRTGANHSVFFFVLVLRVADQI